MGSVVVIPLQIPSIKSSIIRFNTLQVECSVEVREIIRAEDGHDFVLDHNDNGNIYTPPTDPRGYNDDCGIKSS